jgi:hypothetical protein
MSKIALLLFVGFLGTVLLTVGLGETKGESPTVSGKIASELINFQIEEEPNILRLVISGNGRIEAYRSHILSQPLRFVVELPKVTLREPKAFIPMIHPLIEVIRFEINPQKVSLVFEFKDEVIPRYRISQRDHALLVSIESGL